MKINDIDSEEPDSSDREATFGKDSPTRTKTDKRNKGIEDLDPKQKQEFNSLIESSKALLDNLHEIETSGGGESDHP
jgi:hypothetical protein